MWTFANGVGLCFLVFGLLKLTLAILSFSLPPAAQTKLGTVPVINIFVSNDHTFGGRAVDYVLILFSIYSILHGLGLLGARLGVATRVVSDVAFKSWLYGLMGAFLLVVYSLILSGSSALSNDPTRRNVYITDLVAGCGMLAIVPFLSAFPKLF